MLLTAKCLCLCFSTYCGLRRISRRTLWNLFVRFLDLREVLFPRISRISRIFIREIIVICVQKRNSKELWSHANLANPAKCENNQFNPCNLWILFFSVNVMIRMKQLPCTQNPQNTQKGLVLRFWSSEVNVERWTLKGMTMRNKLCESLRLCVRSKNN